MAFQKISKAMTKVFGSRNERMIKRYRLRADEINSHEPTIRKLTDAQLRAKTEEFQSRSAEGEDIKTVLPEVLAIGREVMDRYIGIRSIFNPEANFDPASLPAQLAKQYQSLREQADALEPSDVLGGMPAPGYLQVEIPPEFYEAIREVYTESKPPFRCRPFDVQLIGGMVLGEGRIAEMRTGEGKTIVAPLACYVACCEGLSCHVVTVNDYLVQRDRDWVFPFYYGCGLTVGAIHPQHELEARAAAYAKTPGHRLFNQEEANPRAKFRGAIDLKKQAYECNVLYATNSELGFDYLRDNMKLTAEEQVQKNRDFVIIDEVDSILIDEARTPLIISGQKHAEMPPYEQANVVARHLIEKQKPWQKIDDQVTATDNKIKGLEGDIRNTRDKAEVPAMKQEIESLTEKLYKLEHERDQHVQYYEVEMEKKAAHLTHEGVAEAQKEAGIGSFYVGDNIDFPHLLENALRSYVIYTRDKDYVVHNNEIVIVDVNTGRMMIGRQWSDGLHQAIECKEKVKIKPETQTVATVTIQNFFKLYKRLAGMTGTAITEATEFHEIFSMDVVAIPTNKPIARDDRDDLIFMSVKDKWATILDEIKRMHDLGRPVLVGTTSVENSEMLSQMLKRKYAIKHSVLNAKAENAEREGNIVEDAGQLGAVMIATNMAGRGTDIKLQPIDRAALVKHWQGRNLLPAAAKAEMPDEELIAHFYRHQAQHVLGMKRKDATELSADEAKLRLLRYWLEACGAHKEKYTQTLDIDQCTAEFDKLSDYDQLRIGVYNPHHLAIFNHTETMGGLHIVGTERHESRRIDNQLRGRSGRQGNRGSARFFLSLEDPLMKMFAGDRTKAILSRIGLKEGDAIEHGMVSRSVERAQRKVEQLHYESRKNLLEYDEVMEYQRSTFYGLRQRVLEGKQIKELIFEYIGDAVQDAVNDYLHPGFAREQVAQWAQEKLGVMVDPKRLYLDDPLEVKETLVRRAQDEVHSTIDVTLGEYMSEMIDPSEWDLPGLTNWAKAEFDIDISPESLADASIAEVRADMINRAQEKAASIDLSEIAAYSDPDFAEQQFAKWALEKFSITVDAKRVAGLMQEKKIDEVVDLVLNEARAAYATRERKFPTEYAVALFTQWMQRDQNRALADLFSWTRKRFDLTWSQEEFAKELSGKDIAAWIDENNNQWLGEGGKLKAQAREKADAIRDDAALTDWVKTRFNQEITEEELAEQPDRVALIEEKGMAMFRAELTWLERSVLLDILDKGWKEHLNEMDVLRGSINWAALAEKDPRTEYKKQGSIQFKGMLGNVREQVTERAFRTRLNVEVKPRNTWAGAQTATHAAPGAGQAAPPAGQNAEGKGREAVAASSAKGGDGSDAAPKSRRQRRASAARKRRGQ